MTVVICTRTALSNSRRRRVLPAPRPDRAPSSRWAVSAPGRTARRCGYTSRVECLPRAANIELSMVKQRNEQAFYRKNIPFKTG